MATRTVSNTGGNYTAVATWVEGIAPLSTDNVVFTPTSGNITMNVANQNCLDINFTNFTGTMTFNFALSVNGGTVNFGTGGYNIAGTNTNGLFCQQNISFQSNGTPWKYHLTFAGTNKAYTLLDNLTVNRNVLLAGTTTQAINGNKLYCIENLIVTNGVISGTTEFIHYGTGTISGGTSASYLTNNLTIAPTGTTTFGPTFIYSQGTLTYVSGNTITTGSSLDLRNGTTTKLQTSGMTWNNVGNTNTSTITLLSDLKLNGNLFNIINPFVINATGSSVYIGGGITGNTSISGTAPLILTGSGSWIGVATIQSPLNINTSGIIQVVGSVNYNTGILSYSAGTVITTGSTLTIIAASTLNTSGIIWETIVTNATITLISDLYTINHSQPFANPTTLNGFNYYISGNLSVTTGSNLAGTTNVFLNGTGTWTNAGITKNNLTINTSGTITLGTVINYNTGTLSYSAGTVITTGSNLIVAASSTWNTSGINWNNFTINGGTQTFNQDLNIFGTFSSSNPNTYNGSNINIFGGLTIAQATSGTANLIFKGTGTWAGAGTIGNYFLINSSSGGTLTCSGTISASNLQYSAGTVITTSSTLVSSNTSNIWNTAGITWNNLTIGAGTVTTNSLLTATGTATIGAANTVTFNGTSGFNIGTFICTTAGRIINFATGNTYTINNNMTTTGTLASKIALQSSTVNTKAILNLSANASQDNGYLSGTDIDSSGGRPIFTYKGTLTRTINWNQMSTNPHIIIGDFNNKLFNSLANIDVDAQTFITTAGLTDKSQINAINQLARRLKAQNLWTKLNAIYPFVGGNSTSHSYNLKNTSQFQITWNGTVTHNSNGITPNGTNGYGNTGYIPSLQGVTNNESIGIYSRTSAGFGAAGTAIDMGASIGTGRVLISIRAATGTPNYGTLQLNDSTSSLIQTSTNLDGSGLFIGSRTSSTSLTKSRNGVITDISIVANALVPASISVFIGCRNISGAPSGYTSRNYAFAFLGKGLDATDLENLNDIIQQYQMILGRKV